MNSMKIRPAEENDITKIVELLKVSLGESLMPKSEEYWRWKHVDNPFGPSPVMVAEDDNQIIGVRAFMQWKWTNGKEVINAIRAVDTATHPDHQGKGIFKQLTLELLKHCERKGVSMVFNTPNSKSKPGYLKMGWEEVGKLPVHIGIKNPLGVLKSKVVGSSDVEFLELNDPEYSLDNIFSADNLDMHMDAHWHTFYSFDHLRWRYLQIPIIRYSSHTDDKAGIIFRLKRTSMGKELRVCETFGERKAVMRLINSVYRRCKFDYISLDGFSGVRLPGVLRIQRNIGPDVTIRNLTLNIIDDYRNFKKWRPTLGDLEVF